MSLTENKAKSRRVDALFTELRELMESKVILLTLYVTGVLHTATIILPKSL